MPYRTPAVVKAPTVADEKREYAASLRAYAAEIRPMHTAIFGAAYADEHADSFLESAKRWDESAAWSEERGDA